MVIMLVTGMLAAAASVHLGPALYGRPEAAQQRTYSSEGALKKGSEYWNSCEPIQMVFHDAALTP